jgi:hypothetical protein
MDTLSDPVLSEKSAVGEPVASPPTTTTTATVGKDGDERQQSSVPGDDDLKHKPCMHSATDAKIVFTDMNKEEEAEFIAFAYSQVSEEEEADTSARGEAWTLKQLEVAVNFGPKIVLSATKKDKGKGYSVRMNVKGPDGKLRTTASTNILFPLHRASPQGSGITLLGNTIAKQADARPTSWSGAQQGVSIVAYKDDDVFGDASKSALDTLLDNFEDYQFKSVVPLVASSPEVAAKTVGILHNGTSNQTRAVVTREGERSFMRVRNNIVTKISKEGIGADRAIAKATQEIAIIKDPARAHFFGTNDPNGVMHFVKKAEQVIAEDAHRDAVKEIYGVHVFPICVTLPGNRYRALSAKALEALEDNLGKFLFWSIVQKPSANKRDGCEFNVTLYIQRLVIFGRVRAKDGSDSDAPTSAYCYS